MEKVISLPSVDSYNLYGKVPILEQGRNAESTANKHWHNYHKVLVQSTQRAVSQRKILRRNIPGNWEYYVKITVHDAECGYLLPLPRPNESSPLLI